MATITRTSDKQREAFRRGALAADQGPSDEQQAFSYPRGRELERLGDPQDPTNVTFPFLRRMRRDHMVAMGLHFIEMPLITSGWYFEADDARAAAFADNLVRPIFGSLMLTLLRELWAGFSPAVKNFQTINPKWTYLPGINEDPQAVWTSQSVDAIVYKGVTPLRPENAAPAFKNGNFSGIQYDNRYGGIGYFQIGGEVKPEIDLLHSVWSVHDRESEDGSPFGFPRIAYCSPIFYMYQFIWSLLGRAFENNADPGPVVRYPREDVPQVDSNGDPIKNSQIALRIGGRRRSGSTVALPSEVYLDLQEKPTSVQKWALEYPKNETSFDELLRFVGFLESAKLRALFVQEQGLIEGSGGQSNRNVMENAGEQRDDSQAVLNKQLFRVIEEQLVAPAMAMNMPWYEGKLSMKTVGFTTAEDEVARQLLQLAGQEDFTSFGVDLKQILASKGMPMLSPSDYRKLREERAAQVDKNSVPPEVKPTQGRRALVTQTGFDQETGQPIMSYVQLGGEIQLSGDGDFVAALPKTDAFSDKQVLATTRDLRNTASAFLTWAYGDFARYLGKQKGLDLAQLINEIELEHFDETGEHLADGDKVRKAVDRLMSAWKPRAEKITSFSERVRSSLGRVFDRTTGLHLERLASTRKLSSIDKAAASWLDAQGASMVSTVLDTTREQLASVLADGVRGGKTPKDIASDIREQFDGFPASRAAMIARTEVSKAYNYATVQAGMAAGVAFGQILDGNDDKPCRQRNGKIRRLSELVKETLAHPNAIIAGTFVEPFGDVEVGLSAPWSGPVIELTTAQGNRLAVTPNHPVLTQKGWVAAKFLREGDYVVSASSIDRSGARADLEDKPPRVEELLDALRPTSSHSRVVAAPADLHGDGRLVDGEVDVVRANRLLWREGDVTLVQQGRELMLCRADSEATQLARDCTSDPHRAFVTLAATSSMGGGGVSGVVLRRPYLDSSLAEPLDDGVRMDPKGLAQFGRALARPVAPDQLIKVRRLPRWSGHVYDLQTSSSMYGAGGIVVHNCTLTIRLLPRATTAFDVRYESLDGLQARYDVDAETVLLSPDISRDDESAYLIALGDELVELSHEV